MEEYTWFGSYAKLYAQNSELLWKYKYFCIPPSANSHLFFGQLALEGNYNKYMVHILAKEFYNIINLILK